MKDILVENFVWIKFDATGATKPAAGDRPPRMIVNQLIAPGTLQTPTTEKNLPGISCEINIDMTHSGNEFEVLSNSEVFLSRKEAIKYRIDNHELFPKDSKYALLTFQTVWNNGFYDATLNTQNTTKETPNFGFGEFDDWGESFLFLDEDRTRWVDKKLLLKWFISIRLDNDNNPLKFADDCMNLKGSVDSGDFNKNKDEILKQAYGRNKGIFRPLFEVVFPKKDLDDINYIDILEFAGVVFKESTPLIFACKKHFLRARPETECQIIPHIPTPPHPSFPSAHATHAMLLALVLGEIWPGEKALLIPVAKQIGKNREIAGVHYPTDTLAGQKLAELIFAELMKNNDFTSNYLEPVKEQYNPQPPQSPAQTEGSAPSSLELGE